MCSPGGGYILQHEVMQKFYSDQGTSFRQSALFRVVQDVQEIQDVYDSICSMEQQDGGAQQQDY